MGSNRHIVFLVDDSMTNLAIGHKILKDDYDVFTASSGLILLDKLKIIKPDLILLDIEMPGMSGYDVIKILKSQKETQEIPVIFLTSLSDTKSELKGLSLGAVDYITKPFSPPLLLKRIELHLLIQSQKEDLQNYNNNLQKMVEEKTKAVVELQNAVLRIIAELVECRDDVTGKHIERTQKYLKVLTEALLEEGVYREYISKWDLGLLYQSAQLHDVGKIGIKDIILQKPGKLTIEEFEIMKTHTTFGVQVIKKIEELTSENSFLEYAEIFAGSHHEKWDGSGYPLGLGGSDIPLQGRLMAIVDVYDALTNERPYKKAFTHAQAVGIIAKDRGSHFDPNLVDIFLSCEAKFKKIMLSTIEGA